LLFREVDFEEFDWLLFDLLNYILKLYFLP
jgi:hypothetical protein